MLISFSAPLTQKQKLTADVYLLTYSLPPGQTFIYEAGQYVILFVPQPNAPSARRLYSIASPPANPHSFELLIQCVPHGVAGNYLLQSKVGDSMQFQGPAGMFTIKQTTQPIVFLATGTGIAPIRSMLANLLKEDKDQNISLLWGLKTMEDVYFLDEFIAYQKRYTNFHFHLCLSRQTDMGSIPADVRPFVFSGRITGCISADLLHTSSEFYICGGKEVVESVRAFLEEHAVVKEHIHFEKFT